MKRSWAIRCPALFWGQPHIILLESNVSGSDKGGSLQRNPCKEPLQMLTFILSLSFRHFGSPLVLQWHHGGVTHMKKERLVDVLAEIGFNRQQVRDLITFTLPSKARQDELLAWIHENRESCTIEAVEHKAQEILKAFMAGSPYAVKAKDLPIPKWAPPPVMPEPKPIPKEPEPMIIKAVNPPEQKPIDEDPFDKVLRALFENR